MYLGTNTHRKECMYALDEMWETKANARRGFHITQKTTFDHMFNITVSEHKVVCLLWSSISKQCDVMNALIHTLRFDRLSAKGAFAAASG